MNNKSQISILIPDGESHLTIQVVICLSRNKNYRLHILSTLKTSEIRFSRFVSSFTYHSPTELDADWIDAINREVSRHDIDVIMPVFETGIRKMISNKELLAFPERLVPLPELSSFDIAIDKWLLFVHCKKNGLPCPQSWLYEGADNNEVLLFPVVVKPTTGFGGGMGISLLKDHTDFELYFSKRQWGNTKYLIQEYIEGVDYSCSVLCREGHILAYTIQKSESAEEGHFGPQMAYCFEQNEKIHELVTCLMKSLNWSGIASVDLRYDTQSEAYKILEINTRFWRSLVGSLYAGINFPDLLAQLTLKGNISVESSYEEIRFFDLKGFAGTLQNDISLLFNTKLIRKSTPLNAISQDPVPYIFKFIIRTKNIIMRKF